ncbi:MAG: aldehyde dehydrogenase family protein, partial [Verrucomicrobiae bacterium]|nr:aldehyde dehydrogenase family protein [Verrucomicrobiae bacterium]
PLHAAITRLYLSRRGIRFASSHELAPFAGEQSRPITLTVPRRSSLTWAERVEALRQLRQRLTEAAEKLTELIVSEIHKPVRYARAEVQRSVALVEATLKNALQLHETGRVRYRPLGGVGVITPWNNPVAIPIGKIAPAILYGNTVVWKPSPLAEQVSRALSTLLPSHQLVLGGAEAAVAVMEAVDAVTFTGSSAAGYVAQAVCSRRRIPLQAELGGNNAAIVCEDADLRDAAQQIAEAAFGFAGQRCTANRRVIVLESVLDAFLHELRFAVQSLVCGDPREEATQVGPMITSAAAERVAALVADAEPLFAARAGTVVWGRDPQSEIVQEETFGPVLVVQPARNWDEAIELCNGTRYGLVASLFSRDSRRQPDFL